MATRDFEKIIGKACEDKEIAGAVLLATNRDASFTKLVTSLSALHLVAAKSFSIDDPTLIYTHVPELTSHPVIQPPAADGTPQTKPHTTPITIRHLLTHTSGLTYEYIHPLVLAWATANKKTPARGSTVLERYDAPLAFEPGEAWLYGPSLDFLGLFVERVSGVTLEEYMHTHILSPLGIKDMTFQLSKRPDMRSRLADMTYRHTDNSIHATPETPHYLSYLTLEGNEVSGCFGGEGLLATPAEYLKLIHGVLTTSIIPEPFVTEFFTPQFTLAQSAALQAFMQVDIANAATAGPSKTTRKDWGLGGMLFLEEDRPGGRKEGTMVWAGLPMLAWFVDRDTGICGLFATQLLPTGDPKAAEFARMFEVGIYTLYEEVQKGSVKL